MPMNSQHCMIQDESPAQAPGDEAAAALAQPERTGLAPADAAQRVLFFAWVGQLVRDHRASLAAVARREGLTPDDAFDAVQEAFHTFITLPRARHLVAEDEQSRRLLVTLTRNISRNRRRLHAVARPHVSKPDELANLPAETSTVEEVIAAAEQHALLAGCMQSLDEVPRAVVTLRMLEEVAGEDVARMLGVTPGHVAVLLHRAKSNLCACMTARAGAVPSPAL